MVAQLAHEYHLSPKVILDIAETDDKMLVAMILWLQYVERETNKAMKK